MDPIQYYHNKFGVSESIKEITYGEKYVAIMLENGNIGVCATLDHSLNQEKLNWQTPNFSDITTRIVLNAYYNAFLNYKNTYKKEADIFDEINFSSLSSIVMIGYFESLVQKFKSENIPLQIFDKAVFNLDTSPIENMQKTMKEAENIIITSTSIHNGSFTELIQYCSPNSKIFMLGPSSILDQQMFKNYPIEIIFGSTFEKFDYRILDLIKQGQGTKGFMKYMKKVFLRAEK